MGYTSYRYVSLQLSQNLHNENDRRLNHISQEKPTPTIQKSERGKQQSHLNCAEQHSKHIQMETHDPHLKAKQTGDSFFAMQWSGCQLGSWPCMPLVLPCRGKLVNAPHHVHATPSGVPEVQDAMAVAEVMLDNHVCPCGFCNMSPCIVDDC